MARFELDTLRQLPDYQEVTRWDLSIIQLPSALSFPLPVSEMMNIRCETSTIPKRTNQKMEVSTRRFKIRQPGITDYEGVLTLTFNETVDAAIKRFAKAWLDLIQAPNTGKSLPVSQLKAIIRLELLSRDDEPVYFYNLKGCFLEDSDFGSLEAETSEVQKPSLTISYDDFEDGFIG